MIVGIVVGWIVCGVVAAVWEARRLHSIFPSPLTPADMALLLYLAIIGPLGLISVAGTRALRKGH